MYLIFDNISSAFVCSSGDVGAIELQKIKEEVNLLGQGNTCCNIGVISGRRAKYERLIKMLAHRETREEIHTVDYERERKHLARYLLLDEEKN